MSGSFSDKRGGGAGGGAGEDVGFRMKQMDTHVPNVNSLQVEIGLGLCTLSARSSMQTAAIPSMTSQVASISMRARAVADAR